MMNEMVSELVRVRRFIGKHIDDEDFTIDDATLFDDINETLDKWFEQRARKK